METITQQPKNNKSGYKKWFRVLGWVFFVLGFFSFLSILVGLPDVAVQSSQLWLSGLLPLGFIFLLIGLNGVTNRIIVLALFAFPVLMFLQAGSEPGHARDSAIRATLSSMRSQAEISVVGNGTDTWHYPDNLCDQDNGPMSDLFKGLTSYKARDIQCFVSSDLKSWAVSARLRDSDDIYCSDSVGFFGKVTDIITGPSCESVKVGNNRQ